jgi:hypothetical protein
MKMKYLDDELLGTVTGPDGKKYEAEFYGQNERAAVISGPFRTVGVSGGVGLLQEMPEVCRLPAVSPADARQKLGAWMREGGWSWS